MKCFKLPKAYKCSESKAFYYMNRKGPDSKWIELHKSERFINE